MICQLSFLSVLPEPKWFMAPVTNQKSIPLLLWNNCEHWQKQLRYKNIFRNERKRLTVKGREYIINKFKSIWLRKCRDLQVESPIIFCTCIHAYMHACIHTLFNMHIMKVKDYEKSASSTILLCLANWFKKNFMQGTTKVLSDSPGLVEWLVGLAFSYHSLPNGQALLVLLFWW